MIVDSSVLVAILRNEPEARSFLNVLVDYKGTLRLSAANHLEAAIMVDRNGSGELSERLDTLIETLGIELVPVSAQHARLVPPRHGRLDRLGRSGQQAGGRLLP